MKSANVEWSSIKLEAWKKGKKSLKIEWMKK
jgi:hypothetical protein